MSFYVGSVSRAQRWSRANVESGALSSDGRSWLVTAGEYPYKIAKLVTGDANRWRELIRANPQKKVNAATGNFATLYAGEILRLPDSWVQSVPAAEPALAEAPEVKDSGSDVLPPQPPSSGPSGPVGVSSGAALTPEDVGTAKGLLLAWTHRPGASVVLTDYGARAEDVTPMWGARDGYVGQSFRSWRGLPAGTILDEVLLSELKAWAKEYLSSRAAEVPSSGVVTSPGIVPAGYWSDMGSAKEAAIAAASDAASEAAAAAKASGASDEEQRKAAEEAAAKVADARADQWAVSVNARGSSAGVAVAALVAAGLAVAAGYLR